MSAEKFMNQMIGAIQTGSTLRFRDKYRRAVNWDLVDRHLHVGGVRVEDNLLVTDADPLNLTAAIPKQLA